MKISNSAMPRTVESNRQKQTPASKKDRSLNLWLLFGGLLIVSLLLAVMRALSEEEELSWLLIILPLPTRVGEFSTVLAPLLAISIAVERLLETLFDWYEQASRAVADVLKTSKEALDWVGQEYQNAYEATKQAAEAVGLNASPQSLEVLERAESRLAQAEQRLRSWVQAPEYIAWKRALSIWAGLMVGLAVAVLGDLGMLHTIGIPVPRLLDMCVTGLVVGAGPGPMHSLIGILQSGKNALDDLAGLAKSKSFRESAAAVQKSLESGG